VKQDKFSLEYAEKRRNKGGKKQEAPAPVVRKAEKAEVAELEVTSNEKED
jgi:small subunit ribosomal protein S6